MTWGLHPLHYLQYFLWSINFQISTFRPIPSSTQLPTAQLLRHFRSKMEFLIFQQPESLVPVSGPPLVHPGQSLDSHWSPLPYSHPQLPCFKSLSCLEMFCFHSCCMLQPFFTLSPRRPFPNTEPTRIQPFTAGVNLSPQINLTPWGKCSLVSGCGHGLEARLPWANPSYQCHISIMLVKLVTKVPQRLNLKTKGEIMPII